ncbi:MAG: recombinase family protein [Ruminococcus flavefaciens]|nr:recombinase family protein [Ruminococcus flavefaciens]
MSDRTVKVIPSTINIATHLPEISTRKRRVAAYARVSTDSEEQLTSYEAQMDYYVRYIKENPAWEYAGLYTDEGISATNTKHRNGFNRMIADALDGKIDLIVTKSVSRFARNTVDSLTTVRKLKEKGIEVFFQKENIYTLDSKGELLITIMSSLAQEESRSISENVTWGQRKRFADGKVSLPYKHFLGYKRGEDGLPEIVPEEAEIVRYIYRSFINGMTPYKIAKMLTEKGIPTPSGRIKWQSTTVESILTNEKYKGSALLQKQFTVDFLTKKRKINEGEIPQYFVEHSHDAIISPEEFELVQAEFMRRKALGKQYNSKSIFAARIVCCDCGNYYGSKVWHSTSKYRCVVWQCNRKFDGECKCSTPHLYEDDIKEKFLSACNQVFENRDEILENCRMLQEILTDCSEIDTKQKSVLQEMEIIAELTRKYIMGNSMNVQNQDEYNEHYNALVERYNKEKAKSLSLQKQKEERLAKREIIGGFITELSKRRELLTEFDDNLWVAIIDRVTVLHDGRLIFEFKDGSKIEV